MRISGNPRDPDYVGSYDPVVVLDRAFFTLGPVTMADEAAGVIEYHPVDASGNLVFDQESVCWKIKRVTGQVLIFMEPAWC